MAYYAVFGKNAVAVYDNWEGVLATQKYIKGFKNKRFATFEDAEDYAIQGHEELNPEAPIYTKLPLNYTCYDKKFKKGEEDYDTLTDNI